MPQFYGMPKIHNMKDSTSTVPFRPVTSQCGIYSALISRYLDYYLQKLVKLVPSYVPNSRAVLNKLRGLLIEEGYSLLTSDAKSMYTNMDPVEGLEAIRLYIEEFSCELKERFPKVLILRLLWLVMTNNVFKFGETFWLQLIGTAMGRPCACAYATIFFAYFERIHLFPRFKDNLILYVRFIDDILVVWKETNENPENFNHFRTALNEQCKLKWKTEDLSRSVDFLDVTISLVGGKAQTKTFQKEENLYLYITFNSAHPPGLLVSLVTGRLGTYWEQNSEVKDFILTTGFLFDNLVNRGYSEETLRTVFITAAQLIDEKNNGNKKLTISSSTNDKNNIYFHIPFHPKDVS